MLLMLVAITTQAGDIGYPLAWGGRILPPRDLESPVNPVTALAAGAAHTMALRADGTVAVWGWNQDGQAVPPPGLTGVIAIAAGSYHSLALKADGTVVAWGQDTDGQTDVPAALTNAIAIAAGPHHSAALKADGTVVMWGIMGQQIIINPDLGIVTAITADPINGTDVSAVLADGSVVRSNGNIWAQQTYMGTVNAISQDSNGLIGLRANGTVVVNGTPRAGLTGVAKLVTGSITMAIKSDGTVVSWGTDNSYGQEVLPASLTNVTAVAAGAMHRMAVRTDGTLVGWGNNYYGFSSVPSHLTGIASIDAGGASLNALKPDGTIVEMGGNTGQTGPSIVKMPPGLVATAIASGFGHTLALKADGSVVAWGSNGNGEATPPVGLGGVISIAAGYFHSLAVLSDGTVVAWGKNDSGQTTVPVGLNGVVSVSAGLYHSLALKANGTVVAWGGNHIGQSSVPFGLNQVVAISAGASHSLALKADGTVVGWGRGSDRAWDPPSGLNNVIAISGGFGHSVALTSNGSVVGWGENDYGQISISGNLTGVISVSAGFRYTAIVCRAAQSIQWSQNLIADTATAPITLTAAATSALPISFTSSDPLVAVISDNKLTIVGVGTATITAIQAGDGEFAAASPISRTLTVRARLDFTASFGGDVSVDPQPLAMDGTTLLYAPGTTVTLTASPIEDNYFSTWAGALTGVFNPASLTMSTDQSVTAAFSPKSAQQITGLAANGTVTYGDAPYALTGISGGASGNPIILTSSDPTVASISGSTVTVHRAGVTTISANQAGDSTHLDASPKAQVLTVEKAPLTIAASPKTRVYGQANPPLTWSITGLVNGDDEDDLDMPVTAATLADLNSPLGTYPITVAGAVDANYAITFMDSTLTVYVLDVTSISVRGSVRGGRSPTVTVEGSPVPIVSGSYTGGVAVPGPGVFSVSITVTGDPVHDPGNSETATIELEELDIPVGGG